MFFGKQIILSGSWRIDLASFRKANEETDLTTMENLYIIQFISTFILSVTSITPYEPSCQNGVIIFYSLMLYLKSDERMIY